MLRSIFDIFRFRDEISDGIVLERVPLSFHFAIEVQFPDSRFVLRPTVAAEDIDLEIARGVEIRPGATIRHDALGLKGVIVEAILQFLHGLTHVDNLGWI